MQTPPGSPSSVRARTTYARARLYIGISGVGTSVLAASVLLAADLPNRMLSNSATQPMLQTLSSLALTLVCGVLLLFPFDVLGGAVVLRERPSATAFLARWSRGVMVQLALWVFAAGVLVAASRAGGAAAAVGGFVALQFVLAALRAPLARAIAAFTPAVVSDRQRRVFERAGITPERIVVLETSDEGFVGGWSGILPRRLLLPARWLTLPDDALFATLRRRRIIAESGAHLRGVLAAIAWNALGFALVLALTGVLPSSAAGLVTVAAGMTLWAFVGVLLLPTPSRAAVYAIDAAAAAAVGSAAMTDAIESLDRWQDDEERRSATVETIFHPVPSRSARLARLAAASSEASALSRWHAHHIARHALWLGWGSLSPISRAVHCNVGRPSLWALLPGD